MIVLIASAGRLARLLEPIVGAFPVGFRWLWGTDRQVPNRFQSRGEPGSAGQGARSARSNDQLSVPTACSDEHGVLVQGLQTERGQHATHIGGAISSTQTVLHTIESPGPLSPYDEPNRNDQRHAGDQNLSYL